MTVKEVISLIRVAVCDDDGASIRKIVDFIKKYENENNIPISIDEYKDGEDLLNSKETYDLIFLDIEMERLSGIAAAEKIRQIDTRVQIVYVTNYSKYWQTAYKVHAFDFLEKPFNVLDIFQVLTDFITYKKENDATSISFIVNDGCKVENTNNICYCVFIARKLVLVSTVFGDYDVNENLADIYDRLDHDQFYMSFKDTIINLKYVMDYNSNNQYGITMRDGKKLRLSKSKQKEFYNMLARQLRKINRKIGDDEDEL